MTELRNGNLRFSSWPTSDAGGVCRLGQASSDFENIRGVIRKKYAEVSVSAAGKFQYPTGRDGALALGYDPEIIQSASPRFIESFCGVGNPFSLGDIQTGDTVLDFGCGAGFDLFVASRLVGESGRVCGVDLTEEMVNLAKDNLSRAHLSNIEIRKVDSENIPFAENSFDVVISNGVINLCPDKGLCFGELYRVLKPGGRIQFADVVLENELPSNLSGSLEAWSQWIGGTVPVRDQINLIGKAGFIDIEHLGTTGFRTSDYTVGALFKAKKPA